MTTFTLPHELRGHGDARGADVPFPTGRAARDQENAPHAPETAGESEAA
ncbi:hypothetical protein [Streptomyces sp. NPDC014006]